MAEERSITGSLQKLKSDMKRLIYRRSWSETLIKKNNIAVNELSQQYLFFKKYIVVIIFLVAYSAHSQNQIFVDENRKTIAIDQIRITFQGLDSSMLLNNIPSHLIIDSNQLILLWHPNYEEVEMNFNEFVLKDTIYFLYKSVLLSELIVSSEAITRESHDSLHVIDFHFVKGQLFSIQNSIRNIKQKYLCKNDSCLLIDNRLTLMYNSLNDEQIVLLKDSVYLFNGRKLSYFMSSETYNQKFSNYLGNFATKFYFYDSYFYKLIKEYSCFDMQIEKKSNLYISYDMNSFEFISQQYRTVPTSITDPYFMYATGKKQGEVFRNIEKIIFSKPDIESSSIIKNLNGSPGFLKMIPFLEKSRSEAYLIDSILYIIDFNTNCLLTFTDGIFNSKVDLPILQKVWYRNQFKVDEKTKKCYFYVKEENKNHFVELDLIHTNVRNVKSPDFYNGIYHWEVWDGRFYFLINDDHKLDWQRVFYSYSINDPRMN